MDPEQQADPTPLEGETPATPTPAPVASVEAATPPARVYTAAEYREVQNEAKNLRARLKATEEAASTTAPALEAARSEAETLRGQLAAATEALRAYRLRDAIAETARGSDDLRGLDPDLAARLVEVEYGDDGKPKGLNAALRGLVERYPQIAAGPRVSAQPPAGKAQAAAVITDDLIAQKRRQVGAI